MVAVMKEKPPLNYGYLTDDGEELICAVSQCAISQKARYFMSRILSRALHNSGFERNAGNVAEAGLWCAFDTATWAAEQGWTKQYTSYIREQLISFQMLSWHPIEPGRGKLRVNPNLSEWTPLAPGAHTIRYAKPGSGRPRKNQSSECNEPDSTQASVTNQISDSHTSLTGTGLSLIQGGGKGGRDASGITIGKNKLDLLRPVDDKKPQSLRASLPSEISVVTDACSQSNAGQAPEAPVIKVTEEVITEENTPNGVAPSASDAPLISAADYHEMVRTTVEEVLEHEGCIVETTLAPLPSSSETPQQTTMWTGETQQDTSAKPAAASKKRAKRAPTPEEQELTERKAALAKIWLEHPSSRVMKPQYPSGWSQFNGGIKALVEEDGIQPEEQRALIDAMLTWSKDTYQPTPMKMHKSLDDVHLTLLQLQEQAKKGANHDRRSGNHRSEPRTSEVEPVCSADTLRSEGWNVLP